ncbi:facilitated trehalose transporter Tret1-like [Plodia interpunctella]|uniref:facilitated trehalose transporter Tret1-like n=1 Tax=Plodia interpunctella TaxID=58824 RepID=UPI002367FFC7|nr:facilitated trehalose transporter Tret1-like [Plodia interpunctella]
MTFSNMENNVEGVQPSDKKWHTPFMRQCFITAGVSLNIVAHGCVIGFSAILIPSLRRPESHIHATPAQESWIASVVGVALIMGNFIITPLMGAIGRKRSHLSTIVPIMTGWIMLLLANSVAGLIVARVLQGIAMGMLGPLGSIIIAEMTDPRNRGAFLTCVSLSLTIGVLFSHALGTILSWQYCALICSFLTFTSLIMIIYAPESPSWLISKGRYQEASDIFFWLRGQNDLQVDELESMVKAQKMIRKSSVAGQTLTFGARVKRGFRYFFTTCRKPGFYKPIIIMLFMYIMFQFAGINVISSYAIDIIKDVVGPEANAKVIMVALDIERLICNIMAVFLMKYFARRTVLFSSGSICILAYIGKGTYVYAKENHILPADFENQWIPITLIGIYMFSLTIGISSVPFAISGEIFPLEYRGLAGGLSILPLSLNFFIAVKFFPILKDAITLPYTYFLYGGVVAICLVFLYFMLPETKDRTLQQIEDSLCGISREDRLSSEPLNKEGGELRRCSSHILY